jgi:hypothetical protein
LLVEKRGNSQPVSWVIHRCNNQVAHVWHDFSRTAATPSKWKLKEYEHPTLLSFLNRLCSSDPLHPHQVNVQMARLEGEQTTARLTYTRAVHFKHWCRIIFWRIVLLKVPSNWVIKSPVAGGRECIFFAIVGGSFRTSEFLQTRLTSTQPRPRLLPAPFSLRGATEACISWVRDWSDGKSK